MYEKTNSSQISFEDFYLPFGGHLRGDNRWVTLAGEIDWSGIEEEYSPLLSQSGMGAKALNARIIVGALIIKSRMNITDEETVQSIAENPYMQYFLGYEGYTGQAPFSPSTLTRARERLPADMINEISKKTVCGKLKKKSPQENSR